MRVFFVVVAAFFAGCAAHVQLEKAPSAGDPLEVREAYYAAHRPLGMQVRSTVVVNEAEPGARHRVQTGSTLYLANGARIQHAGDLLPAIDPGSNAGRHAVLAAEAEDNAQPGLTTMTIGFGATGVAIAGAFVFLTAVDAGTLPIIAIAGVGGLGLATGVVGTLMTVPTLATANKERLLTFDAYEDALVDRLGDPVGDRKRLERKKAGKKARLDGDDVATPPPSTTASEPPPPASPSSSASP